MHRGEPLPRPLCYHGSGTLTRKARCGIRTIIVGVVLFCLTIPATLYILHRRTAQLAVNALVQESAKGRAPSFRFREALSELLPADKMPALVGEAQAVELDKFVIVILHADFSDMKASAPVFQMYLLSLDRNGTLLDEAWVTHRTAIEPKEGVLLVNYGKDETVLRHIKYRGGSTVPFRGPLRVKVNGGHFHS